MGYRKSVRLALGVRMRFSESGLATWWTRKDSASLRLPAAGWPARSVSLAQPVTLRTWVLAPLHGSLSSAPYWSAPVPARPGVFDPKGEKRCTGLSRLKTLHHRACHGRTRRLCDSCGCNVWLDHMANGNNERARGLLSQVFASGQELVSHLFCPEYLSLLHGT